MSRGAKEAAAVLLALFCVLGIFLSIPLGLLTMYGDNLALLLIAPAFLIGSGVGLIASIRWFKRLGREGETGPGN